MQGVNMKDEAASIFNAGAGKEILPSKCSRGITEDGETIIYRHRPEQIHTDDTIAVPRSVWASMCYLVRNGSRAIPEHVLDFLENPDNAP